MGKKFEKYKARLTRPARTLGVKKVREIVDTLSIQSIAKHCGVTISHVAGWSTGDAVPTSERAHEVLAVLGISRQDWSTRVPTDAPPPSRR